MLSLNIWCGGAGQLGKMIEIIKTHDADVVGIQEAQGKLSEMAQSLGFYACPEASILSRYPISGMIVNTITCPKGYGVRIEAPTGDILVFNSHLSPWPYGPHVVRDGGDPKAAEATRASEITRVVQLVASVEDHLAIPIFLLGDHNTVSHLDRTDHRWWPPGTSWPVSRVLHDAGFRDSYRVVHPSPEMHPGLTWCTDPNQKHNETQDRIDFIYFKTGGSQTVIAVTVDTLDGTNSVNPWPSDHRGVLSVFHMTPTAMHWGSDVRAAVAHEGQIFIVKGNNLWCVSMDKSVRLVSRNNWSTTRALVSCQKRLFAFCDGLHEVNPQNGTCVLKELKWGEGTVAAVGHNEFIFAVKGSNLWKVPLGDGESQRLSDDNWVTTRALVSCGGELFVIGGALHQVNVNTGACVLLEKEWGPETLAAVAHNGKIYAVKGKKLWAYAPGGAVSILISSNDWDSTRALISCNGRLFVIGQRLHEVVNLENGECKLF